jgi:tetratricopeptide (TPR) repeat protein
MVRSILGLGHSPKPEDLETAIRRLREFGLSQYELEAVQDVIAIGPGNAPPGPGRARAAGLALGQILRKMGEEKLCVVFWDDAELMDPDSMRLVARARKHSDNARLMIIVARGEGPAPWPSPIGSTVLDLKPLGAEPMKQLIGDAMGVHEVEPALIDAVVNIAGGNPRFAGELVMLMGELGKASVNDGVGFLESDSGLRELSLGEVIDWRLERRTELERAVLEVGACIGSMFETWLISATTGMSRAATRPVFDALIRARMFKGRPEEACAFVHQRLRERVIASLSEEDLVAIHGRVAEAMAGSEAAHDPSWRLRCASHLRDSGQRERARDLLATSAAQLEFAGATDAAIDHFSAALELTRGAEEAPVALALGLRTASLSWRCGRVREGLRAVELAIELARTTRNVKEEVKALVLAGRLVGAAGKIEDASNRFREALAAAQRLGDQNTLQMIRGAMGELLVQTGDYRRAIPHLEQATAVSSGPDTARLVLLIATCKGRSGEEEAARELLGSVASLVDEKTDPAFRTGLLIAKATLDTTAGRHEAAAESLQECRELARAFGLHHDNALSTHQLGCVLLALGRPQKAFASLRYSYELAREHGFERLLRLNVVALATLDVLHHRHVDPLVRIQTALAEAREAGFLNDILQIRFYLGQALLALGQPEEARAQLDQARRAGRATGNLVFDADIELLMGGIPAE